jgi:hypothetical protein
VDRRLRKVAATGSFAEFLGNGGRHDDPLIKPGQHVDQQLVQAKQRRRVRDDSRTPEIPGELCFSLTEHRRAKLAELREENDPRQAGQLRCGTR